jgi:hypothetical protein
MFCLVDCVADRVWLTVPQRTEWQRIGDQINAASIFARANFVNVLRVGYRAGQQFG